MLNSCESWSDILLKGFPMKAIFVTTVTTLLHQGRASEIRRAPYTCFSPSAWGSEILIALEILHGITHTHKTFQQCFQAYSNAGRRLNSQCESFMGLWAANASQEEICLSLSLFHVYGLSQGQSAYGIVIFFFYVLIAKERERERVFCLTYGMYSNVLFEISIPGSL